MSDLSTQSRTAARRARLKAQGLCYQCGKQPPIPDQSRCGHCQELSRLANRRRAAAVVAATGVNPGTRRYRERRRAVIAHYGGCCAVCAETTLAFLTIDHVDGGGAEHRRVLKSPDLAGHLFYGDFPAGYQILCWNHNYLKQLARMKADTPPARWRARVRDELLTRYGGVCACCGESSRDLLAVDHVHGGGTKHIRALGSSFDLIRHVRDLGYPADYRLLCHNCNSGRAANGGVCPHQEKMKGER